MGIRIVTMSDSVCGALFSSEFGNQPNSLYKDKFCMLPSWEELETFLSLPDKQTNLEGQLEELMVDAPLVRIRRDFKNRLVWTPELHDLFVEAVRTLGLKT